MAERKLTIAELEKMGFIYKRLKWKNWYLVRYNAKPEKFGYRVIFPLYLKRD